MNPVSQALFVDIPQQLDFALEPACELLTSLGCQVKKIGPHYRFDYIDDIPLAVTFPCLDAKTIAHISICAKLPSEAAGWDSWAKAREMERGRIHEAWLQERGIFSTKVSNLFSPQDGAFKIHIGR